MPAEQQRGMDWRDIPGIPSDCRLAVSEATDRCITAGGIHFCDLSAKLPSGCRDYRLKIQRNARQTHVVVLMTVGGKRASQRRVADFRGGRRVSDIDFRQSTGPTHVCPSQVAKAIGGRSKNDPDTRLRRGPFRAIPASASSRSGCVARRSSRHERNQGALRGCSLPECCRGLI
jgi:hypothetical protein